MHLEPVFPPHPSFVSPFAPKYHDLHATKYLTNTSPIADNADGPTGTTGYQKTPCGGSRHENQTLSDYHVINKDPSKSI
jgi:hypothetical protein